MLDLAFMDNHSFINKIFSVRFIAFVLLFYCILLFTFIALLNTEYLNVKFILLFLIVFPLAFLVIFYREVIRHSNFSYAAMKSMSPIMVTNGDGVIQQVNESYYLIHETNPSECIGRPASFFDPNMEDTDRYNMIYQSLDASGEWRGEVPRQSKSGKEFVDYIQISSLKNFKGLTKKFIISFVDITEEKKLRHELELLTVLDPLTGCKNRRFYKNAVAHQFEIFKRYPEQVFCLALIDIDFFKRVKDEFGHDIGYQVMNSFVRVLESNVRTIDIVCRMGGDVFTIILPNTNAENALILLERIRSSVELSHGHPKISCSIGYTDCSMRDTHNELYKKAEFALKKSKSSGRNQVHYSSAEVKINRAV